jgi:hypothetical protein
LIKNKGRRGNTEDERVTTKIQRHKETERQREIKVKLETYKSCIRNKRMGGAGKKEKEK